MRPPGALRRLRQLTSSSTGRTSAADVQVDEQQTLRAEPGDQRLFELSSTQQKRARD